MGYIPPGTLWEAAAGGSTYEPEPDKYMIYQMKKVKDGYNILSIKSLDTWEAEQQSGVENSQNVTTQDAAALPQFCMWDQYSSGRLWLQPALFLQMLLYCKKVFPCFLQKSRKRFAFFFRQSTIIKKANL